MLINSSQQKDSMKLIRIVSSLLLFTGLNGCGLFEKNDNCQGAIDAVRAKYGPPQDISQTTSSGYGVYTFIYYRKGLAFTFKTDGRTCEQSTSTFTPIYKEVILKMMGFEGYSGNR